MHRQQDAGWAAVGSVDRDRRDCRCQPQVYGSSCPFGRRVKLGLLSGMPSNSSAGPPRARPYSASGKGGVRARGAGEELRVSRDAWGLPGRGNPECRDPTVEGSVDRPEELRVPVKKAEACMLQGTPYPVLQAVGNHWF